MGTTSAISPSPADATVKPDDIELEQNIPGLKMVVPDIEADIEADLKKIK